MTKHTPHMLEVVFRSDGNEAVIYYGDEYLGKFNAKELVTALSQGHTVAHRHGTAAYIICNEFLENE